MRAVNPLVSVSLPDEPQHHSLTDQQRVTQHLAVVLQLLRQRVIIVDAGTRRSDASADCQQTVISTQFAEPVAKLLTSLPLLTISQSQYSARLSALHHLHQYIAVGKYPMAREADSNTHELCQDRQPVFIDPVTGVHCAVAHMMSATGHGELAESIDDTAHNMYIHEIIQLHQYLDNKPHSAADDRQTLQVLQQFISWQHNTGLTLQELAWIQPTYRHRNLCDLPSIRQLDLAEIKQVASLQRDDGSFDTSGRGMMLFVIATQIHERRFKMACDECLLAGVQLRDNDKKTADIWRLNAMIFCTLELRVGTLSQLLAEASAEQPTPSAGWQPNNGLYGKWPHYEIVSDPTATAVLEALYGWLTSTVFAMVPRNPSYRVPVQDATEQANVWMERCRHETLWWVATDIVARQRPSTNYGMWSRLSARCHVQ